MIHSWWSRRARIIIAVHCQTTVPRTSYIAQSNITTAHYWQCYVDGTFTLHLRVDLFLWVIIKWSIVCNKMSELDLHIMCHILDWIIHPWWWRRGRRGSRGQGGCHWRRGCSRGRRGRWRYDVHLSVSDGLEIISSSIMSLIGTNCILWIKNLLPSNQFQNCPTAYIKVLTMKEE